MCEGGEDSSCGKGAGVKSEYVGVGSMHECRRIVLMGGIQGRKASTVQYVGVKLRYQGLIIEVHVKRCMLSSPIIVSRGETGQTFDQPARLSITTSIVIIFPFSTVLVNNCDVCLSYASQTSVIRRTAFVCGKGRR